MNRSILWEMARTALCTLMVVAGLVYVQRRVFADGEVAKPADLVVKTTREVDGVTVTAQVRQDTIGEGKQAVVVLTAVAPKDRAVTLDCQLVLSVTDLKSMVSRIGPISMPVWRQACKLELAAGETRTVELQANLAVPNATLAGLSILTAAEASQQATVMNLRLPANNQTAQTNVPVVPR